MLSCWSWHALSAVSDQGSGSLPQGRISSDCVKLACADHTGDKTEMVDFAVKTYLHRWQLIKENLWAPSIAWKEKLLPCTPVDGTVTEASPFSVIGGKSMLRGRLERISEPLSITMRDTWDTARAMP